jgi:hypothetical protein
MGQNGTHAAAEGAGSTARNGSKAASGGLSAEKSSNTTSGGGAGAGSAEGGGGGAGAGSPGTGPRTSSEGGHHAPHVATPLHVSGGGSAQFRTPGGDNSIQEFGEESSESELKQAAEALHSFYVARANEDWSAACSYLSSTTQKQLEELASRSEQLKDKGCAGVLQAFTQPLPPAIERETTEVDAGSLRREGERGFLIYTGAENKIYAINMTFEGGAWKVAGLAPVPLD